jgi:hypothetical protein
MAQEKREKDKVKITPFPLKQQLFGHVLIQPLWITNYLDGQFT